MLIIAAAAVNDDRDQWLVYVCSNWYRFMEYVCTWCSILGNPIALTIMLYYVCIFVSTGRVYDASFNRHGSISFNRHGCILFLIFWKFKLG